MGIEKGSQLWKLRKRHGTPHRYETPDDLWQVACEYFDMLAENPIIVTKATQHQGCQVDLVEEHPRAPTVLGLCAYMGISEKTWYRNYEGSKVHAEMASRIRDVMKADKIEGAAAGVYNHAIIAKEIGLVEKTETTHNIPQLSDDELDAKIKSLQDEINGK